MCTFERKFAKKKLQKRKKWKITIFIFFPISPEPVELQRRNISHFNPYKISLWPFEVQSYSRVDTFDARKPQSCILFFYTPSTKLFGRLKQTLLFGVRLKGTVCNHWQSRQWHKVKDCLLAQLTTIVVFRVGRHSWVDSH